VPLCPSRLRGRRLPDALRSILERPTMRDTREPLLVKCPKCRRTQIIYIPEEKIPRCPECNVEMIIEELLDEGKSY
jgi:predicted Zn-ribbon and HTH transcriptional regulator